MKLISVLQWGSLGTEEARQFARESSQLGRAHMSGVMIIAPYEKDSGCEVVVLIPHTMGCFFLRSDCVQLLRKETGWLRCSLFLPGPLHTPVHTSLVLAVWRTLAAFL